MVRAFPPLAPACQHAEETEVERRRTEFLAAGGFRVLRFWNHDVLTSTDAVLEEIRKAVSVEVKPPSP